MKDIILGASGFIGQNLARSLAESDRELCLFDLRCNPVLEDIIDEKKITFVQGTFSADYDFENLTENVDTVYHFISTTVPSTDIEYGDEIVQNVNATIKLLDACVKNEVKKIVFISSGGTVYGMSNGVPFREGEDTNPICSYGIQKLSIEKYIQLYERQHGLDYRIIRLANPYGPGQNPNGNLGAVTKFAYNVINGKEITIFGDGGVVRDYIFIGDAIKGIRNITDYNGKYKLFNLGNGRGFSLNEIIDVVEKVSEKKAKIIYEKHRKIDLDYSVLDISRYLSVFTNTKMTDLEAGILKLIEFLEKNY